MDFGNPFKTVVLNTHLGFSNTTGYFKDTDITCDQNQFNQCVLFESHLHKWQKESKCKKYKTMWGKHRVTQIIILKEQMKK